MSVLDKVQFMVDRVAIPAIDEASMLPPFETTFVILFLVSVCCLIFVKTLLT